MADLDDHPGHGAFADHADDLEQWRAVAVEDEKIGAIRELDPPDEQGGEVRDHERKVVMLHDEPAPPETDEEGWMLASSGPCALRATMDGLEPAAVYLHPAAPPDEDSSQLELLVVERACASGEDARGRVEVGVDAGSDEVRVVVGVEPLDGDQTCPENPATPVTVDLDEPLGDRQVVDAGRYPPQALDTAPGDLRVSE